MLHKFRSIFPTVIFLVLARTMSSTVAYPAAVKKAKPIAEWIDEWTKANPELPNGVMLSTALIASQGRGDVKPYSVKNTEFNKLGLLQTESDDTVNLTVALNEKQGNCLKSEAQYMKCLGADTLIIVAEEDWIIKHKIGDTLTQIAKTRAGGKKPTAKMIQSWVAKTFQFDGIVLASDGGLILAKLSPVNLAGTGQSLLLADSADKYTMPTNEKKGSGLVQLVERVGSFATFSIIASDYPEDKVPVGTKFISEKKK